MKNFDNPRLARKISFLRRACLFLGALVLASIALYAARGEMIVRASPTGGRFLSDGALKTIAWVDSPPLYLIAISMYVVFGLFFVACTYAAVAKLVEKFHGRPFFRRKYPY